MILYVETNFLLEHALRHSEHSHCESILNLSEAGKLRLAVPAFCLAEPYHALSGKEDRRMAAHDAVGLELRQLTRSEPLADRASALIELTSLLVRASEEDRTRLDAIVERMLRTTDVVPFDAAVARASSAMRVEYSLSPPDAIVLASIIGHIETHRPPESCFVTRDHTDFLNPDIAQRLTPLGCTQVFTYSDAYQLVTHRLGLPGA